MDYILECHPDQPELLEPRWYQIQKINHVGNLVFQGVRLVLKVMGGSKLVVVLYSWTSRVEGKPASSKYSLSSALQSATETHLVKRGIRPAMGQETHMPSINSARPYKPRTLLPKVYVAGYVTLHEEAAWCIMRLLRPTTGGHIAKRVYGNPSDKNPQKHSVSPWLWQYYFGWRKSCTALYA